VTPPWARPGTFPEPPPTGGVDFESGAAAPVSLPRPVGRAVVARLSGWSAPPAAPDIRPVTPAWGGPPTGYQAWPLGTGDTTVPMDARKCPVSARAGWPRPVMSSGSVWAAS